MKALRLLLFTLALLAGLRGARAASPSFTSFSTNDFVVTTNTAPWIITALRSNTTNSFTNVTIINTNVLIQNTYITNITDNSLVINTNVTVENNFTTNFFDNSVTIFTNSITIFTNTTVTINGTNVATINPTDGRIPYRSGTNSFDDSALYFIDTNTVGAFEVDTGLLGVTNLVAGGIVISVDSGFGYGYLTNGGSLADLILWTNRSGSLQPIDLTLPLLWTNKVTLGKDGSPAIGFGPGSTNTLYRDDTDLVYTNGATDVKLILFNSTGGAAALESQSQTAFLRASGSSTAAGLRAGASQVILSSGVFQPVVDLHEALGNLQQTFADTWTSNLYVRGFTSLTTNYSYLKVSHTGTNGAVVFDSLAAGTAGSPKDFAFAHGGVADFVIAPGLVYAQKDSLASTVPIASYGLLANNTSVATSGQQQNSPAVSWRGSGYSTNLAASESASWGSYAVPSAGANHPTSRLTFYHKEGISGDAGTTGIAFSLDSQGPVVLASVTKAEKTALTGVTDGMLVYQSDNTPGIRAYINGSWVILDTSADP